MDETPGTTAATDDQPRPARAWRGKLAAGVALLAGAVVCVTVGATSFDTSPSFGSSATFLDPVVVQPGGTGRVQIDEGSTGTLTVAPPGGRRYQVEQLKVLDPTGRRLVGVATLKVLPDGRVGREPGTVLSSGTDFSATRGGSYTVTNNTTAKVQVDVVQYRSRVEDHTLVPVALMVAGGVAGVAGLALVVVALMARAAADGDDA